MLYNVRFVCEQFYERTIILQIAQQKLDIHTMIWSAVEAYTFNTFTDAERQDCSLIGDHFGAAIGDDTSADGDAPV